MKSITSSRKVMKKEILKNLKYNIELSWNNANNSNKKYVSTKNISPTLKQSLKSKWRNSIAKLKRMYDLP
jgi:hypothetical protein